MNCSTLLSIVSLAFVSLATPAFALTAVPSSPSTASEQIRSSVNPQFCLVFRGIRPLCRS